MEKFDNKERRRCYGLRVGDTVDVYSINGIKWGQSKVLELCPMDNNRVIIEGKDGNPIDWVAEWCTIITKVEDQ